MSRCRECGGQLYENRAKRTRIDRFPLILALVVLVPILIFASLFAYLLVGFKTYYTPSGAMKPTLQVRDVFLADRLAYWNSDPHDGDIVIFDPPLPASNVFIKRVIATPGETLRIHNGRLYRNAALVNESYIAQPTGYELEVKDYGIYVDGIPLETSRANIPPRENWTSPNTLPRGCFFLLGDNRNNSEDSHIWGFAQRDGFFYSGPQAGRPAGSFQKAAYLIYPSTRLRSL